MKEKLLISSDELNDQDRIDNENLKNIEKLKLVNDETAPTLSQIESATTLSKETNQNIIVTESKSEKDLHVIKPLEDKNTKEEPIYDNNNYKNIIIDINQKENEQTDISQDKNKNMYDENDATFNENDDTTLTITDYDDSTKNKVKCLCILFFTL
jgi:hypothetical protein